MNDAIIKRKLPPIYYGKRKDGTSILVCYECRCERLEEWQSYCPSCGIFLGGPEDSAALIRCYENTRRK